MLLLIILSLLRKQGGYSWTFVNYSPEANWNSEGSLMFSQTPQVKSQFQLKVFSHSTAISNWYIWFKCCFQNFIFLYFTRPFSRSEGFIPCLIEFELENIRNLTKNMGPENILPVSRIWPCDVTQFYKIWRGELRDIIDRVGIK